jgi:hypothetical protein
MTDLQAAADAGARGLLFLTDLPREQVRGQYAPYEGVRWRTRRPTSAPTRALACARRWRRVRPRPA